MLNPPAIDQSEETVAIIQSVEVTELFGAYKYRLVSQESEGDDVQLLILYGDNGSGKSTILKLIFHMLNDEAMNGHRTYVGSIPFKRLRIALSNGFLIEAWRKNAFDLATYNISCKGGATNEHVTWTWRSKSGHLPPNTDSDYLKLCAILGQQKVRLHFLEDSRRTISMTSSRKKTRIHQEDQYYVYLDSDEISPLEHGALVNEAISKTMAWFNREALSATNEGQSSVNAIYGRLIESLLSSSVTNLENEAYSVRRAKIVEQLASLHERNNEFSRYGLTATLNTDGIQDLVEKSQFENIRLLETVLKPYIDGHTARLDALNNVQQLIQTFATLLSEFYHQKTISLMVGKRFEVRGVSGRVIQAENLSSGEKHLLLLFCNTILARHAGSILMIDEPEISLNIKWQRRLVQSLKSCMQGIKGQLILATHSFEILAAHDNSVQQLIDLSGENNS